MAWFDRFTKNKNRGVLQNPGKTRLSLNEIANTGGALRIRDVSNALWFPAGQPINPVAPRGTPPRRYPYQPMSNINWVNREGQIDHQALRNFSYYPIVRDIIETLKDLLCQVEWDYVLKPKDEGESGSALRERSAKDPRLKDVRDFFRKPDGWQPFRVWSRGLYDDMLVLDAASIWKQRNDKNQVCSLVQIDGAQVFPLIDETGQQPDAAPYERVIVQTSTVKASKDQIEKAKKGEKDGGGSPAFQLTPYGFPAQEMTSKELLYAVYNRFTYKRYGYSRLETCLAYVALGLGRLDFQAAYYRAGNVPEGIAFLPPDIPISKVDELNKYLDTILAGNLRNRRKIFFLPSYGTDKQPNIIFPKVNDQVLKDEFDEWIARVLCHNFGLSPMAFTKQINRGEAKEMQSAQKAESVTPCLMWMKDVLDQIIQEDFGYDDIEAKPQPAPEQDEEKLTNNCVAQLTKGIATLDEVREKLGYDTFDEEWSTVPLVLTTNGYVRVDGKNMDGSEPVDPSLQTPIDDSKIPKEAKTPKKDDSPPKGGGGGKGGGKQPPKAKPAEKAAGGLASERVTEVDEEMDDQWIPNSENVFDDTSNTPSSRAVAVESEERGKPFNPSYQIDWNSDWLGKADGRKFDYVRFNLAPEDVAKVLAIHVGDADWTEKGRETDPHVTVLYGFDGIPVEQIEDITSGVGDVEVTLGDLIAFPSTETFQPLVIHLESPKLIELHNALAKLPHTTEHPQYIPHICVGYLKPGTAEKYAAEGYGLKGQVFKLQDLILTRAADKSVTVLAKSARELKKARKRRDSRHNWPNMEVTNAFIGASRLDTKSHEAMSRMKTELETAFGKMRNHFKSRVAKAEGDEISGSTKEEIEKHLERYIEQNFWRLAPSLSKELATAAGAGTLMSVTDLDLTDRGMIEKVNVKALEAAKDRGAEMVGRQWVDGELVDDPKADMSILDTTREAIKNLVVKSFEGDVTVAEAKDGIQKALFEDGPDGVFSDYRAALIARTEIAKAQMAGQLAVWTESGLPLYLKWIALSEEPCEDCDMNDEEIRAIGDEFPDGSKSVADSHPWCNCICTAVLKPEDEEDDEE